MEEKEKEQILHRLDERVANLDSKVDTVQEDVRANRDVFNDRLRKESKKIDTVEDIARGNQLKIAGLGFGTTLLLSIAANNAGMFPI